MVQRVLLGLAGGLVLAMAFEPLALAYLAPVGVAAFVLSVRGLRARWAWVPGLAFGVTFEFVLQVWMRAVGSDAWVAISLLEASFFAVLGSVCCSADAATLVAAVDRRRLGGRRGDPVPMAVGGHAVGSAGLRDRRHPVRRALPYVGANGVSLLVALVGAALAWVVVSLRETRREAERSELVTSEPARTALPAVAGLAGARWAELAAQPGAVRRGHRGQRHRRSRAGQRAR